MDPEFSGRANDRFELSGGALCLDFANSWAFHEDPATDRLLRYADLLDFCRQAGCLPDAQRRSLLVAARLDTAAARRSFRSARRLRTLLTRMFLNHVERGQFDAADLQQFNRRLTESLQYLRLQPDGNRLQWRWETVKSAQLTSPTWPIVRSAAELFTSEDLIRVRHCQAEDCSWLFLDRSRAATRRWCSMESCGNRAKARRHYHRHKAD